VGYLVNNCRQLGTLPWVVRHLVVNWFAFCFYCVSLSTDLSTFFFWYYIW
jgi:hypothetical protein